MISEVSEITGTRGSSEKSCQLGREPGFDLPQSAARQAQIDRNRPTDRWLQKSIDSFITFRVRETAIPVGATPKSSY